MYEFMQIFLLYMNTTLETKNWSQKQRIRQMIVETMSNGDKITIT